MKITKKILSLLVLVLSITLVLGGCTSKKTVIYDKDRNEVFNEGKKEIKIYDKHGRLLKPIYRK